MSLRKPSAPSTQPATTAAVPFWELVELWRRCVETGSPLANTPPVLDVVAPESVPRKISRVAVGISGPRLWRANGQWSRRMRVDEQETYANPVMNRSYAPPGCPGCTLTASRERTTGSASFSSQHDHTRTRPSSVFEHACNQSGSRGWLGLEQSFQRDFTR